MPLRARGEAAEDVAAADHDRGLHAEALDLADVLGDLRGDRRIDAELLLAHQGFAGQLQQDAAGMRWATDHGGAIISDRA